MIPPNLSPIANHLWQSTVFAAAAGLLTLALRKNHAEIRHRIWLAASLKFLIPFSLLISAGSRIEWRTAPVAAPALPVVIEEISRPFALPATAVATPALSLGGSWTPPLMIALWLCGCAFVLGLWFTRWQRIRAAVRAAASLPVAAPIEVKSSPALLEPGIFGVFRPVLLLPAGIAGRLTPAQLDAILAHELCHVRRRDNLAAAAHMLVEALFWFHPLVWWIGARLVEERERACDEEVLARGAEPQTYAEGILNVCKFYVESPLRCAAGVTGGDLKKRIARIMTPRIARNLDRGRKLLLAVAGFAAVAAPVAVGIFNAPPSRAQSAPALSFEVASVKANKSGDRGYALPPPGHGKLTATNVPLADLIVEAYQIQENQLIGASGWMRTERFDISAKSAGVATRAELRQMLQALLAERFGLKLHRESKELPMYAITVAKNGPKMKPVDAGICDTLPPGEPCGGFKVSNRRHVQGYKVTLQELGDVLSVLTGRSVLDKTGLAGRFDFQLDWTPDESAARALERPEAPGAEPGGPSLFTAMQEQLGLKLESQKGPVPVLVIDGAARPTEN